ncbi:MAG: reverse transcriptase domain-containing protein [Pseudomonadota bacterium]
MTPRTLVALALADTFLAGEGSYSALLAGATWTLGAKPRWASSLCRALLARTGEHFHYFSRAELASIIVAHEAFAQAWLGPGARPAVRRYCLDLPRPTAAPDWRLALDLPSLPDQAALAAWLDTAPASLPWLADQWRNGGASATALQHYHYRWLEKRSGGLRLLEVPKPQLRALQSRILRGMLDKVPPHPAAHGFRRAHNCVSHATLHVGQRAVLKMDLKDFFTSIPAARIHALFTKLGYSDSVAGTLARLCTHRTPGSVVDAAGVPWPQRQILRERHLPQGSPCSPALANLCAFRLDLRLAALAQTLGAQYSRYADDLVMSGGPDLERAGERLSIQVAAIALEEGFALNTRKTRLMRAARRQRVTGIVVNARTNIARAEFDALKATLHNCARHGPRSQNRDARADFEQHLAGKVAYVSMVNPRRGLRLRQLFERIAWCEETSPTNDGRAAGTSGP